MPPNDLYYSISSYTPVANSGHVPPKSLEARCPHFLADQTALAAEASGGEGAARSADSASGERYTTKCTATRPRICARVCMSQGCLYALPQNIRSHGVKGCFCSGSECSVCCVSVQRHRCGPNQHQRGHFPGHHRQDEGGFKEGVRPGERVQSSTSLRCSTALGG